MTELRHMVSNSLRDFIDHVAINHAKESKKQPRICFTLERDLKIAKITLSSFFPLPMLPLPSQWLTSLGLGVRVGVGRGMYPGAGILTVLYLEPRRLACPIPSLLAQWPQLML